MESLTPETRMRCAVVCPCSTHQYTYKVCIPILRSSYLLLTKARLARCECTRSSQLIAPGPWGCDSHVHYSIGTGPEGSRLLTTYVHLYMSSYTGAANVRGNLAHHPGDLYILTFVAPMYGAMGRGQGSRSPFQPYATGTNAEDGECRRCGQPWILLSNQAGVLSYLHRL